MNANGVAYPVRILDPPVYNVPAGENLGGNQIANDRTPLVYYAVRPATNKYDKDYYKTSSYSKHVSQKDKIEFVRFDASTRDKATPASLSHQCFTVVLFQGTLADFCYTLGLNMVTDNYAPTVMWNFDTLYYLLPEK